MFMKCNEKEQSCAVELRAVRQQNKAKFHCCLVRSCWMFADESSSSIQAIRDCAALYVATSATTSQPAKEYPVFLAEQHSSNHNWYDNSECLKNAIWKSRAAYSDATKFCMFWSYIIQALHPANKRKLILTLEPPTESFLPRNIFKIV